MDADLDRLRALVAHGVAAGAFHAVDLTYAAMQILTLVDGLSVQAATRATIDYTIVHTMVTETVERAVGLPPASLADAPQHATRRRPAPAQHRIRPDPPRH